MKTIQNLFINKRYQLLGHFCMLLLLVLAVIYANERVLLSDSALQLFYDINHDGMQINDNRYTMVLSQILPWIAIHLHAPLKLIIIAYSVSFVLIGYACWLITSYAMGQRKAAMVMIFSLLAIGGTFMHCISETFQLIFYASMLYGWLCCSPDKVRMGKVGYFLILALLVAITFFIYPMATVYILFAAGFRLFDNGRLRFSSQPLAAIALLATFIILYMMLGMSGHDSEFVPTSNRIWYGLTHFFSLGSMLMFYRLFLPLYLFPTILLIITLIGYARQKHWLKFVFLLGCVVISFVAVVLIYWHGDLDIARERYFVPQVFMIGLAFIEDELPRLNKQRTMAFDIVFCALLIFSFGRIIYYVHRYQPRIEAIANVSAAAREQGLHKLVVTRSTAEEVFPGDIWGLALESMMLTAQDGPEKTVTIYKEEDDYNHSDSTLYYNPDIYIALSWWQYWKVDELNPRYFSLPEQGYKELKVDNDKYLFCDI